MTFYKIQETSGAAIVYCPYVPLAVSGANVSIAPASPPPPNKLTTHYSNLMVMPEMLLPFGFWKISQRNLEKYRTSMISCAPK